MYQLLNGIFRILYTLFLFFVYGFLLVNSAEAQSICTAPHGGKLTANYVQGPNANGRGQATIFNNSSTCTYLVGLASYSAYEPFDPDPLNLNWIYTQTYYAHVQQNLSPGQSVTFQVNIPSCAWQIDAYQNDVLIDLLPGQLYQDNGTLIGGGWLQNNASYPLCTRYTVSGRVFEDFTPYNNSYDTGEPVFSGVRVEITRRLADGSYQPPCCYTNSSNTDPSGIFRWSSIVTPGTYRIFVPTIPAGYFSAASNPRERTVTSRSISVNFPLRRTATPTPTRTPTPTPTPSAFSISGSVFDDKNKNYRRDSGEDYTNGINITRSPVVGNLVENDSLGTFTITNLQTGTYLIENRAPFAPGYAASWPVPQQFQVTVGSGCDTNPKLPGGGPATCTNGNVTNVNFGITNSNPWLQSYGLDMRFDSGFTNLIPQNPNTSCKDNGVTYTMRPSPQSTTPGILFIGNRSFDPGFGQVSVTRWLVGGTSYSEVFRPTTSELKTSYAFMRNNARQQEETLIDIRTISTCGQLDNCRLPGSLNSGVYVTELDDDGIYGNNPLILTGNTTFSSDRDYLFLVDGDLTIKGSIIVSAPATATFSVAGDIKIDNAVGTSTLGCPASPNLAGLFSADESFIIESRADCPNNVSDLQLNVAGSIVVNAKRQDGTLNWNSRDLCGNNLNYPVFTISARPDFLINAPLFILRPNIIWQEVAP